MTYCSHTPTKILVSSRGTVFLKGTVSQQLNGSCMGSSIMLLMDPFMYICTQLKFFKNIFAILKFHGN